MNAQPTQSLWAPLWIIIAVFAVGGASSAVMRMESWTNQSGSFALDVTAHTRVQKSLLQYEETATVSLPINDAHAFTVADDGKLYVCGEQTVSVLDRAGALQRTLSPKQKPRCVAVANSDHDYAGHVYVGSGASIEVFSPSGQWIATWETKAKLPLLTAIALTPQHVYVADAGNQVVLQFDFAGQRTATIDNGFVVPSANFDLVAEPNGLLHVVNPGARRVETYTSDGIREMAWGQTGSSISDFFGCCNPSHVAMLPGGRVVTSEKGIPRIKIYDSAGRLQSVVADTVQLLKTPTSQAFSSESSDNASNTVEGRDVFDIATDGAERILVLDSHADQIRIFTPKSSSSESL
jgi:hypothetical protein